MQNSRSSEQFTITDAPSLVRGSTCSVAGGVRFSSRESRFPKTHQQRNTLSCVSGRSMVKDMKTSLEVLDCFFERQPAEGLFTSAPGVLGGCGSMAEARGLRPMMREGWDSVVI